MNNSSISVGPNVNKLVTRNNGSSQSQFNPHVGSQNTSTRPKGKCRGGAARLVTGKCTSCGRNCYITGDSKCPAQKNGITLNVGDILESSVGVK